MKIGLDTDFRRAMRMSESSGDYGILNKIDKGRQVLGGYQFSPERLADYTKATGEKFTQDEFLDDPELQTRVMDWHEQDILNYVTDKGLDQHLGKNIAGIDITPASLVAAAHLGGRYGMRQFLESGGEYDPQDKYGTRISDYMKKFGGYNLYDYTPVRPQGKYDTRISDYMKKFGGYNLYDYTPVRPRERGFNIGVNPDMLRPEVGAVRPKMRPKGLLD
jgi:hypothetical protein